MTTSPLPSTRPYLIRALYEWCCEYAFTPYLAVKVDARVLVPREHVRDGEIVLNIGPTATSSLKLGNEVIEFKARFGGVARDIYVPVDRVMAIYARENGQGMSFPMQDMQAASPQDASTLLPFSVSETESSPDSDQSEPLEGQEVKPTSPKSKQPKLQSVSSRPADEDPPEPPPAGQEGASKRPSLKRVK
ncbi:MAG: ClpXP protease specificity-enhancing factor [Betaproteobacteria bacterium]|nr:ClpXP protease specificity-enhancing factor [Betaproteobacteria bacterium]NDD11481.1 ClpXP protease specificity-enhancing factor [Betaproteobacteria bacterium]